MPRVLRGGCGREATRRLPLAYRDARGRSTRCPLMSPLSPRVWEQPLGRGFPSWRQEPLGATDPYLSLLSPSSTPLPSTRPVPGPTSALGHAQPILREATSPWDLRAGKTPTPPRQRPVQGRQQHSSPSWLCGSTHQNSSTDLCTLWPLTDFRIFKRRRLYVFALIITDDPCKSVEILNNKFL